MATQHAGVKRLEAPFGAFVVDGFNFVGAFPDVRHWLLTHAHSDHTCGLRATFDAGTIYCSTITRGLISRDVSPRLERRVVVLDPGGRVVVGDVRVTALDAGHCPGSLLFLCEHAPSGRTCLHTGDMRASASVREQAGLAAFRGTGAGTLDALYLDTTYANPRHDFPDQVDALALIRRIVADELEREPSTLFLVGAYSARRRRLARHALPQNSGPTGPPPPQRPAGWSQAACRRAAAAACAAAALVARA